MAGQSCNLGSARSWRGQVECVAPGRGALGSGGHRSPRSSQRAPGSVLRQWLGPVVSHCSLEAACAERPALDGIQPDKDTARRHDALSIGQRAACPRLTVAEARGPVGGERLLPAPDGQFLARQEAGRRAVGGVSA